MKALPFVSVRLLTTSELVCTEPRKTSLAFPPVSTFTSKPVTINPGIPRRRGLWVLHAFAGSFTIAVASHGCILTGAQSAMFFEGETTP